MVAVSGAWWNPLDWDDFVDGIVEGMGEALVWLLDLAFNNPLTVVSAAEWQAAFGQAARWGGVFAVVAVAVCAVEIVAGIIASDHTRILRGWVWAILAWPLTAASLLVFTRLVNASDWLTTAILNSIQAPEVVAGSVAATGATSAVTTVLVGMLLGVGTLSAWWLALIFIALALLPVIGLVIVLGAVTFGQIALAGFAPVALMLVGFRGTRAMSSKWLQMAVALLLTKPIAAGIIALGCAVGAQGGADGLILGIIAVTVAVASPALAFSFVGFAGAQIGGAMTVHSDKVKGLATSLTHAGANQGVGALRDRLGGAARAAAATAGAGAAGAGAATGGLGAGARAGDDVRRRSAAKAAGGAGNAPAEKVTSPADRTTTAGKDAGRGAAGGAGPVVPEYGATTQDVDVDGPGSDYEVPAGDGWPAAELVGLDPLGTDTGAAGGKAPTIDETPAEDGPSTADRARRPGGGTGTTPDTGRLSRDAARLAGPIATPTGSTTGPATPAGGGNTGTSAASRGPTPAGTASPSASPSPPTSATSAPVAQNRGDHADSAAGVDRGDDGGQVRPVVPREPERVDGADDGGRPGTGPNPFGGER